MANQVASVSVNGTVENPKTTAFTVGLGTSLIRSIEPFSGAHPLSGVTILTVIKMQSNGTRVSAPVWLSPTATATVITAAT